MSGRDDNLFWASHDAGRIAQLEAKLRSDPENRQLRVQLANAVKRQQRAENAFRQSLGSHQVDVVDYRIVQSTEKYALLGVSESLGTFQKSLTAVYDSVTNGAKERSKYTLAVKEKSRLYFDYTYPGSIGFMLSIKNEQDLLGGELDKAIETYYEYLEISSTDDAIEASRHLGLAAISELYAWIDTNASWGYSIDYNWVVTGSKIRGRFIDSDRFKFIKEVFDGAEDQDEKIIKFDGVLVGLDVETRRFHITEPGGESYKGSLDASYTMVEKTIPHMYRAVLKQTTRKTPATGKSTVNYSLLELVDII